MRRDDKFRFSLQWGTDTEQKVQVGSLLERLGNKKSDFIIQAASEYMQRHPEIAVPGAEIKITYQPMQTREQMMASVKDIARAAVEEYLSGKTLIPTEEVQEPVEEKLSDLDLDAMVAGLSFFDM